MILKKWMCLRICGSVFALYCIASFFFGKKQIIAWIAKGILLEAVNTMIM